MQTFKLDIVTPEGMGFSGECIEVIIPGSEGIFGVLAKHMNFISSIKPGRVVVKFASEPEIIYVVDGGIAEIKAGECSVLAENCIKLADVDVSKAKSKIQELLLVLENADSEIQRESINTQLEYYRAQIA